MFISHKAYFLFKINKSHVYKSNTKPLYESNMIIKVGNILSGQDDIL